MLTGLAFALYSIQYRSRWGRIRRQNDQWHISIRDGGIETADMLVSAVGLSINRWSPTCRVAKRSTDRSFTLPGGSRLFAGWQNRCGNRHRRQCHSVRSRSPPGGPLLVCQRSPQYVLPRDERPIHSNGLWEQIDPGPSVWHLSRTNRTRRRGSARMTTQGQAAFLARLEREVRTRNYVAN